MTHTFTSSIWNGPNFCEEGEFDQEIIKNEPMFFNCNFDFAMKNGGPITKSFLDSFLDDTVDDYFSPHPNDLIFDSRVHMLMPGWYPCIPGFHHDDVPRSLDTGQPNYRNPEYRSKHVLGLVNGDICPTEFALGTEVFSSVPKDQIAYKVWHEEVVSKIDLGTLSRVPAESNRLIYFDDRTWHQGVPAVKNGWRWFGRLSWDTDRSKNPTNEIRRQVQVYLEFPMEGW